MEKENKRTPQQRQNDKIVEVLTKEQLNILLTKFRYLENPNDNIKILNGKLMI